MLGFVEVQLSQRPIDHELVIVALDDEHLPVEGLGLGIDRLDDGFEGAAVVAELLVERVRVDGHLYDACPRARAPAKLALIQARLACSRRTNSRQYFSMCSLLVVVRARQVQRRKGRSAEGSSARSL